MKAIRHSVAALLVATTLFAADPATNSVFQVRLIRDTAAADTQQMTLPRLTKHANGTALEVVHVQKPPLMDHTMVHSAWVVTNGLAGVPEIAIEFTKQGAKRLASLTEESVGKRVAILIDGRPQSAPRILAPITVSRITVDGPFTVEKANNLVAKINKASSK